MSRARVSSIATEVLHHAVQRAVLPYRRIAQLLRGVGHLCQLRLLRLLCLLLRALLPDGFGLVVRADDARVDAERRAIAVDSGVDVDFVQLIPRVIIQGKTRYKSDFGNPQIWKHCCECWKRPPVRAAFLLAVVSDDEFATGCFSFRPAHGVG